MQVGDLGQGQERVGRGEPGCGAGVGHGSGTQGQALGQSMGDAYVLIFTGL